MAPFAQKRMLAHLNPDHVDREPAATGRPSEYRQEYCQMVFDYMAKGYSLSAFAGSIAMSRDAVYDWMSAHREFSNAVARARMARVAALEVKLLASRKGAETTASIFALRNADPLEWRDVRNVQHDHAVNVQIMTDAQLYAIASGKPAGEADTIEGEFTRSDATR